MELEDWAREFESRYDLVLRTAGHYAPNPSLARDIAQQSFLIFMRKMAKELPRDVVSDNAMPLDALLRGIVKNVAMKVWQQERKNAPEALRRIDERFLTPPAAPEHDTQNEEHIAALKTCMETMPWRSREFLDRHYRDGISIEQIGRENGVKPGTLRQAFCRMRARLRECIENKLRKER